MKALRIHLHQNSANYRKEETIDNKMTYPLPPYSTVIGALHDICGFKEYREMDLSIQGNYGSLQKRAYTDHCFLNSTHNDRDILVKLYNPDCLSRGYEQAGHAIGPKGKSDFRKDINVITENKELMQEYRDLKDLKDEIKRSKEAKSTECKQKKLECSARIKDLDAGSDACKKLKEEEKRIDTEEKEYNDKMKQYEDENYNIPFSYFRTLTTSLKYYEILTDLELYIHVRSDDQTLQMIYDHIYDLRFLGRSEDFVEVLDAGIVELAEDTQEKHRSHYAGYISERAIMDKCIFMRGRNVSFAGATKYYLNKNYHIVDGKRIFEKKKVFYLSLYEANKRSRGIFFDKVNDEITLIVDLV